MVAVCDNRNGTRPRRWRAPARVPDRPGSATRHDTAGTGKDAGRAVPRDHLARGTRARCPSYTLAVEVTNS
ncbi:hypothetical protein GCM10022220_09300 [Actinocatenispora rupis]|uniref:Uncharacterized protein n=1 Tax=Actinocatenispora rupis TaxID=519421 RepID=A0A8J3NAZ0_9ACTN|nr:hypothetical protein Aru02nite_09610 [Actinocatenispora rupis]